MVKICHSVLCIILCHNDTSSFYLYPFIFFIRLSVLCLDSFTQYDSYYVVLFHVCNPINILAINVKRCIFNNGVLQCFAKCLLNTYCWSGVTFILEIAYYACINIVIIFHEVQSFINYFILLSYYMHCSICFMIFLYYCIARLTKLSFGICCIY